MSQDLPSIGRIEDGTHRLAVRVYYEDTDFTGVVYHATYLRYFERGRSEFLRAMGPPPGHGEDPGAFAVVRIEIDYLAAARIHQPLLIRTAFRGIKGPRMIFHQRVERDQSRPCEAVVIAVPLFADGRVRRPSAAELAHWALYRSQSPGEPD